MKIVSVDCNYIQNEFASSYLLVAEGATPRGFFVECNTSYAIPFLIRAAEKAGIRRENIDGLIITHVHLDHAGGAGTFLQEFPNAKLYAHPRAARHAIDPSRLIASATQVYGEAFMKETYGEILPCPADRVVILNDHDEIDWKEAAHKISTHHLRGHANHHLVAIEPETRTLFSGDAFGVSYPQINRNGSMVIVPSTSPTDFDASAAIESVKWIRDQKPARIGLTHFGFLPGEQVANAAEQLLTHLEFSEALRKRAMVENLPEENIYEALKSHVREYYQKAKHELTKEDLNLLDLDLKINAQGLKFAANS